MSSDKQFDTKLDKLARAAEKEKQTKKEKTTMKFTKRTIEVNQLKYRVMKYALVITSLVLAGVALCYVAYHQGYQDKVADAARIEKLVSQSKQ